MKAISARRIVLLAALVVVFGYGVVAAQDTGGGGVGGRPAYPREDNPRSSSIFIHTLNPSESAKDGVNIINNSEEIKTVRVYATDSVNSSGGAFACAQEVDDKLDVGAWINLKSNRITLDTTASEIVPFNITVPANADVGEHNGCIVVQEDKADPSTEQGVGLSFRTAIRVAILVPGDVVKDISLVGFTADVSSNKVTLTPQIENKGNVSVDTDISTTLSYLWGQTVSEVGGRFPVLRGQVSEWNFDHDWPFWGGWYKTGVSAAYDDNPDNFIGNTEEPNKFINYPGQYVFIRPHPIALAIELAGLLLIIYGGTRFAAWRKYRKAYKTTWKSYKVKSGATIKDLAKISGISWRLIAKANKLKPPYTLEAGQSIKLPPRKK